MQQTLPSLIEIQDKLAALQAQLASGEYQTTEESLGRLQEILSTCLKAFSQDEWVQTQSCLEDLFAHTLLAMKTLSIDPDRALLRAMERLKLHRQEQSLLIFADHVEIRVGHELRGGWPLYSEEDLENAIQVARELGCEVLYPDSKQLYLFESHAPE